MKNRRDIIRRKRRNYSPVVKKVAPEKRTGEQFRHELKYIISEGEKEAMKSRMRGYFSTDSHAIDGKYFIRSLYFDDYDGSAYEEKNDGVLERKKYRIRIYNCSDRPIKLERKKKYDAFIYKESADLTHEEFDRIIAGDYGFLLKNPQPLCREFYVECMANVMRPRVIVDYDREPWLIDAGTVRVTFDCNVRAAVGNFDIFNPDLPTLSVLDPGQVVLEVKYTEFLPQIVKELLPPKAADISAFSKYTMCCDKTMYKSAPEYFFDDGHQMPSRSRAFAKEYKTEDYIFPHYVKK